MHSGLGLLGCSEAGASQRPPCVAQQTVRIVNRGLGHVGEFCGHRQHSVFDLVTTQLGAGTQLGRDRMRACARRPRPIPQPRAHGAADCMDALPGRRDPTNRFGQQPRIRRIRHVRRTTVVSARTRPVRNTLASAALTSSASLSPSTAALPHRVVSFINVVGCGTNPSNGIRQKRRQVIESPTSRHNDSYPSR